MENALLTQTNRHTKLNEKQLKGLDQELKNLHKELIELRNKHIAHAGSSKYSKSELLIEFDNDYNRIYASHVEFSSFNFNFEIFGSLINELIKIVDKCAEDCFQNIKETLNKTSNSIIIESFLPIEFKFFHSMK